MNPTPYSETKKLQKPRLGEQDKGNVDVFNISEKKLDA